MTEKFWKRSDDWFTYAPCFGVKDFTLPPERDDGGETADEVTVTQMCSFCRVRPECAKTAYLEQWNDVWVCGVWIPGHDVDRRQATLLRNDLFESVPDELERRGGDV